MDLDHGEHGEHRDATPCRSVCSVVNKPGRQEASDADRCLLIRPFMSKLDLTFPELLFLVTTHVLLGAGIAFLFADRVKTARQKAVGGALLAGGIATGVPRVMILLRGKERDRQLRAAIHES
jgi:hypothetical protein